jgi:hypothetical protein
MAVLLSGLESLLNTILIKENSMGRPKGSYINKVGIDDDKFWAKINKNGPNGCWEWTGVRDNRNYGTLYRLGKFWFAHRYSWFIHNGEFTQPVIRHKCDNPSCANPAHLEEGTMADNVRDRDSRGRTGSRPLHNPSSRKLTDDQARAIKQATGSLDKVAAEFNTSRGIVWDIRRGRTYRDIV